MGLANVPWSRIYGDNKATCNTQYSNTNPVQTSCIYLQDLFGTPNYLWNQMGCLIDTDGTLYLTLADHECYIAAINPNKTPKWIRQVEGSYDEWWWSGLALDDTGRLYIGGNRGIFFCLDKTTGEILWSFTVPPGPPGDEYPDSYIWSVPVVTPDNTVIFASWQLYCFYPNGVQKWTRMLDYYMYEKQIGLGDNGLVYAAPWPDDDTPAHIYAVNASDGTVVHTWTDPDGPKHYYDEALDRCPPVITTSGLVLVSVPHGGTSPYPDRGRGRIWCFNPDLTPRWDIDLYPIGYWCHPLGAVGLSPDEQTYYMFDWGGLNFSFDIPTGNINWVIDRYNWLEFKDLTSNGLPRHVEAPIAIDPNGNLYLPFYGDRADGTDTFWLAVMRPNGTLIKVVELINEFGGSSNNLFSGPSIAPNGDIHLFDEYGFWYMLGSGSALKYWTGTEWKTAKRLLEWDGVQWVEKHGKYWDGTEWKQFI